MKSPLTSENSIAFLVFSTLACVLFCLDRTWVTAVPFLICIGFNALMLIENKGVQRTEILNQNETEALVKSLDLQMKAVSHQLSASKNMAEEVQKNSRSIQALASHLSLDKVM